MFVPLHVKSEHSLGHGTSSVDALVRHAVGFGFPALALTDVENLHGQVKFHHAARAHGLRAITGVELRSGYGPKSPGRRLGRLILLARDRAGYASLCHIVSRRRTAPRGQDDDPVRNVLAFEPREGLFYLSDDADVLDTLRARGVDAGDLRFLLVRPGPETHPSTATHRAPAGIRVVADVDVVMADASDGELHALLAAIRQQVPLGAAITEPVARSLPPAARIAEWFADAPNAVAESVAIAEACTLDLLDLRPPLPSLAGLDDDAARARLALRCRVALARGRERGRWRGAHYDERLERELGAIAARGLAGWFLIVAEISDRAQAMGIEVAGRGSAASSLIVHLLGLSSVDPVASDLLFERFLHTARQDLPDVDLDVASDRRDELIAAVFERFGAERVAMASALQTFQRRAAYREGLQAIGWSASEVARFAEAMPPPELEGDLDLPPPLERLDARTRAFVPLIERLVGKPRHVSVHPGGIVIAEPRIADWVPLERAAKGVVVTQYDMHSLAQLGIVKIDLLGNRALSAIAVADAQRGVVSGVHDADPATAALIRSGDTLGCFQIESPAVRSTLARLPIADIHDVAAALAIVRPGPASGDAKRAFIRRANGEELPTPPHPTLATLLDATHGLLLYEEDLVRSIAAMTGFPIEVADTLRADLIAVDPATEASLERGFVVAATARGHHPADVGHVWRELRRFAAYSFNRAHALSYAQIAWRCAWLAAHHPAALACGVLDHYGGQYPLRTIAAAFARRGVGLLAPHVEHSAESTRLEDDAVRIGLAAVKGLTRTGRERLLALRPFHDFADLVARARLSVPELEAIVLCGACDDLAPLGRERYPFAHEAFVARMRVVGAERAIEAFPAQLARGPNVVRYRRLVRIFNELRFLDMHPSDHPMRVLRDEAERVGCIGSDALPAHVGASVRFAGVVAASRRLVTRQRRIMQFVTFEDEHGLVEATLPPDVYAALDDPVRNPGPFLIEGLVETEGGEIRLTVSEVLPFYRRAAA